MMLIKRALLLAGLCFSLPLIDAKVTLRQATREQVASRQQRRYFARRAQVSPPTCASGVLDPASSTGCCTEDRVGTDQDSGLKICCPADRQLSNSICCDANTDSTPGGCCPSGERFDCFYHFPSGGCCPADQYIEGTGCCDSDKTYIDHSDKQACCDYTVKDGQCPGTFLQRCSDGINCDADLKCMDDGTKSGTNRCYTSPGLSCTTDAQCGPSPNACAPTAFVPLVEIGGPTCQSSSAAADTLFGPCDPKDANACTAGSSDNLVCAQTSALAKWLCYLKDGESCLIQATSNGQTYQSALPEYCASANCVNNVCSPPSRLRRSNIRRSLLDSQPEVFEKRSDERRHLLTAQEALDMLAGHGVFSYRGKIIRDGSFMRKRSRWSDIAARSLGRVAKWSTETLARRAGTYLMNPTGQIKLSSNFKMETKDAPAVIQGLLDDRHFESFDYEDWFTVDREALQALSDKLEEYRAAKKIPKLVKRDL